MKIFYKQLNKYKVDKLIIRCLEQALYQAVVVIEGEEHIVWDTPNKTLLSRNLIQLREKFEHFDIQEYVLRHESAYDEMIGLPTDNQHRRDNNRMEVPLAKNPYFTPE